jgi:hypothetical protein
MGGKAMKRNPRFSIAGLMGVVLVAAIGLAALRNPTELWDGVMFLLTCGVLMLSVVGVVCRGGAERAWWLGFALFGWGYLTLAFSCPHELLPRLLSTVLLQHVTPRMDEPGMMRGGGFRSVPLLLQFGAIGGGFGGGPNVGLSPWRIGHCLWTLMAAVLGGTLARLLFAAPAQRSETPAAELQPAAVSVRKWWRRPALIGLGGLVLYTCLALAGLRRAPGLWAGGTFLLSWGLIGLAVLGAVYGRGTRRASGLGAALFGAGTMLLIFGPGSTEDLVPRLATNHLLNAVRNALPAGATEFPASSKSVAAANARIKRALERPIPLRFPSETPLEDALKFIEEQTADPDGRRLAIYVDPVGLNEAEKTMTSPLQINLENVPLKTSLRLALKQIGLTYSVWEGVLLITSAYSDEPLPVYNDPFLIVGNCVLALLAAGLGGVLAPRVAGRSSG